MMNVRTMRRIVDEVQVGAVPRVVTDAAARWDAGGPVHVRSSANHVFRVLRNGRPCYLRLAHDSERRPNAIQAELDFVLHAAGAGLAVARPLVSTRGALIEELEDGGGRYHAVVFDALHGTQHDCGELDEPMLRAWGRALAGLHRASETFPARPARADWRQEVRTALEIVPPGESDVAGVLASGWRGSMRCRYTSTVCCTATSSWTTSSGTGVGSRCSTSTPRCTGGTRWTSRSPWRTCGAPAAPIATSE